MKIPQLEKKLEIKSCHNLTWEDNYSWIHQENILEVLKDSTKLLPEVRKYLEEENKFTEFHLKDTKKIQKELFNEIKGRIKLDDESLPFKDKHYEYWTKTTEKGNYSIKLRKKIGSDKIEEIWNGDFEKEKLKTEYFGVGDLEVSWNDRLLAYSLDLRGSEYYTIYVRDIFTNEPVTKRVPSRIFIKFMKLCSDKYNCRFFLATGQNKEEQKILDDITNSEYKQYCTSLDKLPIEKITPLISNCNISVCNDSSFSHLSAAVGINTIVLMTDTPLIYGTYSSKMYAIIPDGENTVSHNTLGKEKINPEKIFIKLKEILG